MALSLSLQNPHTQTKTHGLINLNTLINPNCKVNCWGCLDNYKLNKHAELLQTNQRGVRFRELSIYQPILFVHPAAHTYEKNKPIINIATPNQHF